MKVRVEFYRRNDKWKNKPSMYHWVYTYRIDDNETMEVTGPSKESIIKCCISICLDKRLFGFRFKFKSEDVAVYLEEKSC